jgi:hypothetical protein
MKTGIIENKSDNIEDVSFLLYLLPIILTAGSFIWGITENNSYLDAYLFATRNSLIFIISVIAIAGAVLLEINYTTIERRYNVLVNHTKRMKTLGIAILLLSIIGSLLAVESVLAIGSAMGLFLTARFPIAFAAIMFLQAAFLRVPFTKKPKEEKMIMKLISVICIAIVPLVYFTGNLLKFPFVINLSMSLLVVIVGIYLFSRTE